MADRIDLSNIFINFLKKARYQRHIDEETLQEDQFYATTDGNEQCEYGDLFGNIEDQIDLYNALCASRLYKKDMCNDPRGYAIVKALKDSCDKQLTFNLQPLTSNDHWAFTIEGNPDLSDLSNYQGDNENYIRIRNVTSALPSQFFIIAKWEGNQGNYMAVNSAYPYQPIYRYTSITDDLVCNFNTRVQVGLGDVPPYYIYHQYIGLCDMSLLQGFSTILDFTVPLNLDTLRIGTDILHSTKVFSNEYVIQTDAYPLYNIEIPYYQSKDGAKIVDVQYKDRVDQLYDLTGQGNYIIIDEANEEFRLPLPDLYSQLENKSSFILRKWED